MILFLFYQFQVYADVLFNVFAFGEFQCGFYTDFTHFVRLLSDGSCHGAVLNGFDAVIGAIEAYDEELFVSCFSCRYSAESHFVILSEDSFYVAIALKNVFSNGEALAAVEVCSLFCEDFQFLISDVVEALAAFTGSRCARDAFEFSYRSAFAEFGNDVFSCHFAAFDVVGSDVYSDFTFFRCAVEGDDRDLCFVSSQYGVGNCCGVYRVYQKNADISLQKVSDVVGLFSRVILRVNDFDSYACFFSSCFYAVCHGDEEWIVLGGYREADGDFLCTGSGSRFCLLVGTTTTGSSYESCTNESCQCDFLKQLNFLLSFSCDP